MNIILIGILITVIMILYIIFAQFWLFICDTVLNVFERWLPAVGKKNNEQEIPGKENRKSK